MTFNQPRIRSTRFVIVVMLTLAMVFAHWQGLAHRIAHASQHPVAAAMASAGASSDAPSSSDEKAVQHSCLAYDAATVSPALHTPGCTVAAIPAGRVLAQWVAFESWHAPFTPYFSSRAPPVRLTA